MDVGALQAGSIFAGDYRIATPLASGGMGAVYVADQLSTGKQRALKLMHPQLVADANLRKRFEQEARIGSRIESEHVVDVVAAGVDAATGMPWLAMELLKGEDLARHVAARGALPTSEVRAIFEQLCHAVSAAHTTGIVHRDLKPENIFLAQAKRAGATFMVKVLDFGIARLSAEAGSRSTAAMGSPLWMAPEQTERAAIGPCTDVWALGLIAYYLLTGTFYWRNGQHADATMTQLLREILFEPLVPPSERAKEVGRAQQIPSGFDAFFARCVSRDPNARFRDAGELWKAFAAILDGAPIAATAPMTPHIVPYAPYPASPPPAFVGTPMNVAQPAKPSGGSSVGWLLLLFGTLVVFGVVGVGAFVFVFRKK